VWVLTAIQSTTGGRTAPVSSTLVGGSAAASDTDSLLSAAPEPTALDLANVLSAMYALLLDDEGSDAQSGAYRVQSDESQRQFALQQQMQEIQREAHDTSGHGFFSCIGKLLKDITGDVAKLHLGALVGDTLSDVSACDNPKFWSDLEVGAKIVAAIAGAAATVCTAGAAGPVVAGVAVALSAAGFAVQQTRCFGNASTWVGEGLTLGAGVVSGGGTLLASSAAGAASLAQTASSASNAASLAQTAGIAANTTSAGATIVSGAAHIAVTGYQADALDAEANAQADKQTASLLAQMEQWAIDTLGAQVQAHRDAMASLTKAMQTNQQSSLIAAGVLSRG
jgi:hypothetical protein